MQVIKINFKNSLFIVIKVFKIVTYKLKENTKNQSIKTDHHVQISHANANWFGFLPENTKV